MNTFWLLVQYAEEGAAESPSVFNLQLGTSFWTLIIFFTLLFVLMKWAFPPILGYAQAREERIQQSLDDAQKAQEEARRALEEQRRELARAREEAQEIIAQGKQDAETVRQELLNRAKEEQQEIVDRAKSDIEREREQALETIRREAVELSIAAASHLVSRRLDRDEDRRLVEDYLDRVKTHQASAGEA
jgi:F-type H+-transporting ATPase subunit b